MKHIKETERTHRPWVKNAAIVFLSVMLVLTFFSQTIMNISLPQVSGQYLSSGTISRSVSGSGTVMANLAYNVQLAETRTVKSVDIAAGDTVTAGQVLFTLEEAESEELKTAQEALDQMEYDYGLALIQNVDADYASEYQSIAAIQEQLSIALEDQEQAAVDQEEYDSARSAVSDAQKAVTDLQTDIASLQSTLALSGAGDPTLAGLRTALTDAQAVQAANAASLAAREAEVTAAQSAVTVPVADAQAALDAANAELTRRQQERDGLDGGAANAAWPAAEQAVAEQQAAVDNAQLVLAQAQAEEAALDEATHQRDMAKTVLDSAVAATQAAQQAVDDRVTELTDADATQQLAEKQAALITAQARLAQTQTELAELDGAGSYDAATETVRALRQQLASANAALAEQQRADGVQAEATDYDLQAKADAIEEQKALVEKLRTDASNDRITAQYGGTVASVTAVTGDIVGPGVTMATIHVEGKEFSLTMPVTAEQSQELSVGDQAQTTDYYFGGIQAVLTAIRNDPDAPGKNKLLEFTVSGDVVDGQNLSLSIDLGSQNYPIVAPKSAIRNDADGDFILAAETESSPLGNRYVVKRVPVTVVATDAYNAAIETATGLNYYYVVTTSTAPLSPGDQVRLTEQ